MSALPAPGFLLLPAEDRLSRVREMKYLLIKLLAEPLASKARGWIQDWFRRGLISVQRSLLSLISRAVRF